MGCSSLVWCKRGSELRGGVPEESGSCFLLRNFWESDKARLAVFARDKLHIPSCPSSNSLPMI